VMGVEQRGSAASLRILERQDQREVHRRDAAIKLDLSATSFAFQGF
jgi:hypothetical protein